MHLNPYGEDAVRLAVDLVRRPPQTPAELAGRCRAAGLAIDCEPVDAGDLAEAGAFLAEWLEVVDAADAPARARLLNTLLSGASAHPRLSDHASDGWHLHYREPGLRLGRQLRALIAMGTALHLTGRGMDRLGRCAAADCGAPFADVSRTGRQRYCSPACGNRDAVRRHRSRVSANG
jgi:predicted RNA-binding Zn ribbon-like protein